MSFQEDQIEGHTQTGERDDNVKPGPNDRRCEEGDKKIKSGYYTRTQHKGSLAAAFIIKLKSEKTKNILPWAKYVFSHVGTFIIILLIKGFKSGRM